MVYTTNQGTPGILRSKNKWSGSEIDHKFFWTRKAEVATLTLGRYFYMSCIQHVAILSLKDTPTRLLRK